MASAIDTQRLAAGALATFMTAALVWCGTGLEPFWLFTWFAPLPVLLFATEASWWGAALAAFFGMTLGLLNLWDLFYGALHAPAAIIVRIYAIEGIVFALAVLLWRALLKHGAHWSAAVSFPALLVSFEWLMNLTSPHGTGGSLAYSQLAFLPFLQLASITGPWGMSFLLLLFPAALAIAWQLRDTAREQAYRVVGATLGVLVAVLVFGAVRLASPPPAGDMVRVGLATSDTPANEDVADEGAPTAQLFQAYAPVISGLASQGAQVVVIPEKLGVEVAPVEDADGLLQNAVDRSGVTLVAGLISVVPPLKYNEARVYRPHLPVLHYDKQHMLPPFESKLTPGTELLTLRQHSALWGVEICKDMDFTPLAREYGRQGVGLMLVPGWDFFLDYIQHGHMAIMRGVESGFSVVRAAKGGSLFVSDDRGRILAEVKGDSAPFATLVADVPASHDKTLFLLLGDWFAWVAVAALAFCLVQLGRRWKAG
jgi:apolipoprotein N-acyltransferase